MRRAEKNTADDLRSQVARRYFSVLLPISISRVALSICCSTALMLFPTFRYKLEQPFHTAFHKGFENDGEHFIKERHTPGPFEWKEPDAAADSTVSRPDS